MATDIAVLQSQWLEGHVRHRRKTPVTHQFGYATGMLALDLDEWETIAQISPLMSTERFNWVSLYRRDYFLPEQPDLKSTVKNWVTDATGWEPDGKIELITHPRYLGHIFNPVSFYFCYQAGAGPADGGVPKVILAQITNTPWKDRHVYCLQTRHGGECADENHWISERFRFPKRFHVSPFNPMDQDYQWFFGFRGNQLRIHMNVYREQAKVFDATLEIQRTPLSRTVFHRSLRRFPLECAKVVAGIYWHALRLKLKGAPFYTHPDKTHSTAPSFRQGADDRGAEFADHQSDQSGTGRVSSWRT